MVKVCGVIVMILLEMLEFLMLIVLYHLIPIIKNNFLVLDEEVTEGINDIVGLAKKEVKINFSKAKTKFCLSFHCCC